MDFQLITQYCRYNSCTPGSHYSKMLGLVVYSLFVWP